MRRSVAFACAVALAASAASAETQKTIKDPVEYNAYMTALNTADPAAKAAAMEAFLKTYPTSVVREDALEQAMGAYQQAGDTAHLEDTARRINAIDPNNVRVLAVLSALSRAHATAPGVAPDRTMAYAEQAGVEGELGSTVLRTWAKPEDMTDADFAKLKRQMTSIFSGARAFQALQHKDYAAAKIYYAAALAADPQDLQNAYQLAIADLESNPADPAGFWWGAHAWNLASGNAAGQTAIQNYVLARYRRFHGSDEGWQGVVTQAAAAATEPPAGFSVKARPTPAELAVQAVAENDVGALSFSDWLFILNQRDASAANKAAADKVWNAILARQGSARMQFPAKVVAASVDSLDVAVSDDAQHSNTVEMHVVLATRPSQPPVAGSSVNVVGRLTGYTTGPVRLTMEGASLQP